MMSKYPKSHRTFWLEDGTQVNVHYGSKYNYWFIQPSAKPIKLTKAEVPSRLYQHSLNLALKST